MQIVKCVEVMHLFQISLQRSDKLFQRLHILLEICARSKQLGPFRREAVHHLNRGRVQSIREMSKFMIIILIRSEFFVC